MALLKVVTAEKPRQIAARILRTRLLEEKYSENLLEIEFASHSLTGADRGLCQELVYGVVRRQGTLDWLIARKTGDRTQRPALRVLLQLGLYQMFYLDRIPDHAAINETVELAKQSGFVAQSGFVNAILRGYAREREATQKVLADLKKTEPPVGHSHPAWLHERWRARWGAENAARLMEWNNQPPPTYARVNLLKTRPEDLLKQWEGEGVQAEPVRWDWTTDDTLFRLDNHPPLARLPSFQQGGFYVQDPSTLLAVQVLEPRSGETILDLCAAPGGKTTAMAQRMQNRGLIVAQDLQPDRLELVRENCVRLGVVCVEVGLASTAAASAAGGATATPARQYDRVLVDAPCSNTGVMRRRVDLRWRIRAEEIQRLRGTQLDLLRRVAPLVKLGGTLVYSTCSLESEENHSVVEEFLRGHPRFELRGERELLPFTHGVDGAYVARLFAARD